MSIARREYKDRLFCYLFGREENKAWTLSLYNAVNGSDYRNPAAIRFNTISEVIYLSMHNDVSFLIADEVDLFEHQSTYNPNMPLRMLQYISSLYERYIAETGQNKYSSTRMEIPAPKLVVFYNGVDDQPDEVTLCLSDSFPKNMDGDIEVKVRMVNINRGRNKALMAACGPLQEYAWFIHAIRQADKEFPFGDAIEQAISNMPDGFVIKPFLVGHKAEVKDMLLTEYDEAKTMQMFREEGREKGREEGREEEALASARRMIARGKLTLQEIAEDVALPLSKVEELAREHGA